MSHLSDDMGNFLFDYLITSNDGDRTQLKLLLILAIGMKLHYETMNTGRLEKLRLEELFNHPIEHRQDLNLVSFRHYWRKGVRPGGTLDTMFKYVTKPSDPVSKYIPTVKAFDDFTLLEMNENIN